MRLSPVALVVVASAALFTADAAKINHTIRKNRSNAEQQRNLYGKGKGKGGSKGSEADTRTALTRAEDDGMNRGQICAAGLARSDMMMKVIMPNNTGGKGGKGGKSGKSGSGRRGLKAGTKTETVRRRLCVNKADGIEADEVISLGKGKAGKAGKSGSRRRERELSGKGKGGSSSDGMFGRADDDSCLCIETEEVINWADDVSTSGKSGKSGSSGMDINGGVDADEISSSGKSGKSGNSRRERRLSGKGKGGKGSSTMAVGGRADDDCGPVINYTPDIDCVEYCECKCSDDMAEEAAINYADLITNYSGGGSRGKSGKSGKSGSNGLNTRVDIDADTVSGKGKAGKSGSRRRERELSGKGKGGKGGKGYSGNRYADAAILAILARATDVASECGKCACKEAVVTPKPTPKPSSPPTKSPTERPTFKPTKSPTTKPTPKPSPAPTPSPTRRPSNAPTPQPTDKPTNDPTPAPSAAPVMDFTNRFGEETCVKSHPSFPSGTYDSLAGWSVMITADTTISCDETGKWDIGWPDDGPFDALVLFRNGVEIMRWGVSCPDKYPVQEGDNLVFYSDNSHEYEGFRICTEALDGLLPTPPPEGVTRGDCFVSHPDYTGPVDPVTYYDELSGYSFIIDKPGRLVQTDFNIRGYPTGQALTLWRNSTIVEKWQGTNGPKGFDVQVNDVITWFADDSSINEENFGFEVCMLPP